MISNAGNAPSGTIAEVSDELLRKSFEVNFFSHQNCASEAVKIIKKVAGVKKSIEFEESNIPKQQGDSNHSANIDLAKKVLGWKPETSFKDGILATIKNHY